MSAPPRFCQSCAQLLDNTGTICNACIARTLIPRPILRPILLGKGTPVPAPNPVIYVEYPARVLVEVDMESGGVTNVVTVIDKTAAQPTGEVFMSPGSDASFTPAVVPTPPPKFTSPEEADAWLEANHGKARADAIEITQKEHDVALDIAKNVDWDAWLQ